jgi:hypothetical protein
MTNAELDQQIIDKEARQGERMLEAVYKFLGRFVAYPSEHARVAHALWCVHAHLMDRWDSTPRIAFLSPEPASGKSRALEITQLLVPNPVLAVNMSPAYIFRRIGAEDGCTLLYDEIDTVFGPKAKENEEIRGLLNAGHRRGAVAGRCVVRGKTVEIEELPAYCALALAGLGWLPDTIMTRSVVIRMRRRHAGEKVEPYRPRINDTQGAAVRILIERWVASLPDTLEWPELPPEIQDRDADVWEPLIVIADAVGGSWPERARVSAVSLVSSAREREASLGIKLLMDCRTAFADADRLPTKALLQRLISLDESPWGDIRGKPLDERGLAHRLRQYSIESRQIRISDITLKGYRREDFVDPWQRYAPLKADNTETSETSETPAKKASEINGNPVSDDVSDTGNVSDSRFGVSDDVSDTLPKNGNEINDVSCVSHVSHLSEAEGRTCIQCRGKPDGTEVTIDGTTLHRECVGFWRRAGRH